MTPEPDLYLSRPKAALLVGAMVVLGASVVVVSFGGRVKGLFETADAEIDTVDFECAREPTWKERVVDSLPSLPRSGFLSSTYSGGSGARDHMAALVDAGALLDDRSVRLEALSAQYHQPVPVPPGQAVALFAGTEHAVIDADGGTTHLQVGVQATSMERPRRPRLAIALAIDVSGSMGDHGKLIEAKAAAKALVDQLDPDDLLAVVTYEDEARMLRPLQPVGDGADAVSIVAGLRAGGGTNLHEGLALAHMAARSGAGDAVRRVLLLSDGEPTVGQTQPAAIRRVAYDGFESGVETSALGVGLDFNSELMMSIASDGQGNYHFIDSADAIAGVLQAELEELTHVVAQALRLTVRVDDDVDVVRVLGAEVLDDAAAQEGLATERGLDQRIADELGIPEDRAAAPSDGLTLMLPNFHLGRHHVVILEVRVPPGSLPRSVARVSLDAKDLVAGRNHAEAQTLRVDRGDRRAQVGSLDAAVKKNLLGYQAGLALVDAGRAVEAERTSDALRILQDQATLLGVAGERWRDDDLTRDAALLADYQTAVRDRLRGRRSAASRRHLAMSMGANGYRLLP